MLNDFTSSASMIRHVASGKYLSLDCNADNLLDDKVWLTIRDKIEHKADPIRDKMIRNDNPQYLSQHWYIISIDKDHYALMNKLSKRLAVVEDGSMRNNVQVLQGASGQAAYHGHTYSSGSVFHQHRESADGGWIIEPYNGHVTIKFRLSGCLIGPFGRKPDEDQPVSQYDSQLDQYDFQLWDIEPV